LRISASADGLPEYSILTISVRTVTPMSWWVSRSVKVRKREDIISRDLPQPIGEVKRHF
jgi:hypothetical protein